MLGGEELGVDLVESCEVAGIVEEHVDADDVFKGVSGGFEHLLEVFEGDAGLYGDVAGDDFAVGVAVIFLLKETSVFSAISLMDLMFTSILSTNGCPLTKSQPSAPAALEKGRAPGLVGVP